MPEAAVSPEPGSILVRIVLDPAAPSGRILPVPGKERVDSSGNTVPVQLRFHKGEPPLWVPPSMIPLLFGDGACAKYRMPEKDANGRFVYSPIFERVDNVEPPTVPSLSELHTELAKLQAKIEMASTQAAGVPTPVDDTPAPAPFTVDVTAQPDIEPGADGVVETTVDGCLICPECNDYTTPSDSKDAPKALSMHRRMKHHRTPKE